MSVADCHFLLLDHREYALLTIVFVHLNGTIQPEVLELVDLLAILNLCIDSPIVNCSEQVRLHFAASSPEIIKLFFSHLFC